MTNHQPSTLHANGQTALSILSGDNPAGGSLGLWIERPRPDVPLRTAVYRSGLPFVNPLVRKPLVNS